jgi:hypothetical protein
MIYIPGKLLYVHIPRTGGISVTSALAQAVLPRFGAIVATANGPGLLRRHARAVDLIHLLPEWAEIPKFAVDRPVAEIVESDYRLHQAEWQSHQASPLRSDPQWVSSVERHARMTLAEFRVARWEPWLSGRTPWEHWCCDHDGRDMGIIRIEFADLQTRWLEMTLAAGLDTPPPLPHLNHAHV